MNQNAVAIAMIENLDSPMYVVDNEFRLKYFNRAFILLMKCLFGVEVHTDGNILEYIHNKPYRQIVNLCVNKVLSGEPNVSREECPGGEISRCIELETHFKPLFDEELKLFAVSAEIRCITELFQELRLKQKSNDNYRLLFHTIQHGAGLYRIILDDEGIPVDYRIEEINEADARMLMKTREELIGKTIREIYPGANSESIRYYAHTALTGEPIQFEFYSTVLDKYIYNTAYSPKKYYFAAIHEDITGRKLTELTIRENEEMLSHLFKISPNAISITNMKTRCYVNVNERFLEKTRYTRDEVIGRSAIELNIWVDIELMKKIFKNAQSGEQVRDLEFPYRTKTGEIGYGMLSAAMMEIQGEPCLIASLMDITDLKSTEKKLYETEALFNHIYRVSPNAISITRLRDLKMLDVNENYVKYTGIPREELIGANPYNLGHWVDREEIERLFERLKLGQMITNYEIRYRHKSGEIRYALVSTVMIEISGDACILNSVMDINDRKRIEIELEQYRMHLETLVQQRTTDLNLLNEGYQATLDALPDLMFDVDLRGVIHDFHTPDSGMLYSRPDFFLDKALAEVIPAEAAEILQSAIIKANAVGRCSGIVYSLSQPEGIRWYEASISRKQSMDESEKRFIVLIRDITLNRQYETALMIKDSAIESSVNAIGISDLNGIVEYVNPAFLKMWGYESIDEVAGRSILEFWEEMDKTAIYNEKMFETGKWQGELTGLRKDGRRFSTEIISNIILDKYGKPIKYLATVIDITERKISQQALKASEERYKMLFQYAATPMLVVNMSEIYTSFTELQKIGISDFEKFLVEDVGSAKEILHLFKVVESNREARKMLRTDRSVHRILISESYFLPETWEVFIRLVTAIYQKGSFEGELPIKEESGQERRMIITAIVSPSYRKTLEKVFISFMDISERKQAENALRASEELYRQMFEEHTAIKLIIEPETGDIIDANSAAAEFYGYSLSDMKQMNIAVVNPMQPERLYQLRRRVLLREKPYLTFSHRLADGSYRDVEVYSAPIQIRGRTLVYSIIHDITQRKKAEKNLRDSEEKFSKIFNNAPIMMGISTVKEGKYLDINEEFCRVSGFSREEAIGKTSIELGWISAEQRRKMLELFTEKGSFDNMEITFIAKSGKLVDTICSGEPIEIDNEKYLLTIALDITVMKKAEESIRRQDDLLRLTGEIAKVGGWEFDPVTGDGSWTDGVAWIHDKDPSDETNLQIGLNVYEGEYRRLIENAIRLAIENGAQYDLTLKMHTHLGHEKWVKTVGIPIRKDGKTVKIRGFFQDITEITEAELLLKKSLEEQEILLREIYHRTRNNMQQIISIMRLQQSQIEDPVVREMFRDMEVRLTALSLIQSKLYALGNLSKVEMKEYFILLVETLKTKNEVSPQKIRFNLDNLEQVDITIDAAIPCGLILNELIGNSIKHAFPGDRVGEITILLERLPERRIRFAVSDNGIGLPESFDPSQNGKIGLKIVCMLGQIQLQGELHFDRCNGCCVSLSFNEDVYV